MRLASWVKFSEDEDCTPDVSEQAGRSKTADPRTGVLRQACSTPDSARLLRKVAAEDEGERSKGRLGVDFKHPAQIRQRFGMVQPEVGKDNEGDMRVRGDQGGETFLQSKGFQGG